MSDTFAPSARPQYAAIAWATKDEIFVEIPCKDGPPYICRYHKTESGLAAALNIMVKHHSEETHRAATRAMRPLVKFSPSMREVTREILKRRKII